MEDVQRGLQELKKENSEKSVTLTSNLSFNA